MDGDGVLEEFASNEGIVAQNGSWHRWRYEKKICQWHVHTQYQQTDGLGLNNITDKVG